MDASSMASSSQSRHVSTTKPELGPWAPVYSHDEKSSDEDDSYLESSFHVLAGQATRLKLPSRAPSFLITPLDGGFTPYSDRSPATSPTEEREDPFGLPAVSLSSPPAALTTPIRSRAASLAFKKILLDQAPRLFDIRAAWKRKFPPLSTEARIVAVPALPLHRADTLTVLGNTLPPRRTRSVAGNNRSSGAEANERLSLCDADDSFVDVRRWKMEAVEAEIRRDAITAWIGGLILADTNQKWEDSVEWPEPGTV